MKTPQLLDYAQDRWLPGDSGLAEIDHVVAGALVAASLVQAFADPAILRQAPRAAFYKAAAITGLIMGPLVLLLWHAAGRPVAEFGMFGWLGADAYVTLLAAAAWLVLLLVSFRLCAGPLRAPLADYYSKFRHLMPERPEELVPAHAAGSFAGAAEEIAFRGFLIWYFQALAGLPVAVLLSSVLFGIAHGYQGVRGMAFGAVAGLVLAAAYLASGSLLLAMWMHATYNIASFTLGYRLLGEPRPLRSS